MFFCSFDFLHLFKTYATGLFHGGKKENGSPVQPPIVLNP
jgi:hypothetical protein